MALSHFADLVNLSFIDPLVRFCEVALNEWLPMFLGDRTERIWLPARYSGRFRSRTIF